MECSAFEKFNLLIRGFNLAGIGIYSQCLQLGNKVATTVLVVKATTVKILPIYRTVKYRASPKGCLKAGFAYTITKVTWYSQNYYDIYGTKISNKTVIMDNITKQQ